MTRKKSEQKKILDKLRVKHAKPKHVRGEAKIRPKNGRSGYSNGKKKSGKTIVLPGSFDFQSTFLLQCENCKGHMSGSWKHKETGRFYCDKCFKDLFEFDLSKKSGCVDV